MPAEDKSVPDPHVLAAITAAVAATAPTDASLVEAT